MIIDIDNNFKNLLAKIKSESIVADMLYKATESSDVKGIKDNCPNYIKISESEKSKISYLPTNKIDGIIQKLKKENNGEIDLSYDDMFNLPGRVKIKYGAFVNKIFDKDEAGIIQKDIEIFDSLVKSIINRPDHRFEIVNGNDINKYYMSDYHHSGHGSLGASCMRHSKCYDLLDFYAETDEVELLIMFSNDSNLILGRALLWNLDGFKFMDRIYSIDDAYFNIFIEYASENGYAWKEKQSFATPYRFRNTEGNFEKKIVYKFKKYDYRIKYDEYGERISSGGFPYLDTMKWVDINTGSFYNYRPEPNEVSDIRNVYNLSSTTGQLYGYNYLLEDEYHKEYNFENNIVYCEYLKMFVNRNKLVYSKINDQYILIGHYESHDFINDIIFNEEYDHFNNKEGINKAVEKRKLEIAAKLEKSKKYQSEMNTIFSKWFKRYKKVLKDDYVKNDSDDNKESDYDTVDTNKSEYFESFINSIKKSSTSGSYQKIINNYQKMMTNSNYGFFYTDDISTNNNNNNNNNQTDTE